MNLRLAILLLVFAATACVESSAPEPEETKLQWMERNADRYLEDRAWRRAELEASLWQPELPYARKRLAGYALEQGGWDLLGLLTTSVGPVRPGQSSDDFIGAPVSELSKKPESRDEWLQLGEDVFWRLPMRRDAYLEWVVERPELWDEVGLETNPDGSVRGLVRFRDARGDVRVGATCGFCHGEDGRAGQASRSLDLGRGRELYGEANGIDNSIFGEWGPGTVDVTDDGVVDSLAIPDLWGTSHQTHLNASGAVKLASPASMAIRFETQYVVGHSFEARPDRRMTWALAMFVMSLDRPSADELPSEGAEVFDQRCAGCHQPDRGYSGDLISSELIASDPQASQSTLRGTGYYKTPSLIGVSRGGPYLHDASAPTLEALLDGGHPYGDSVEGADRDALLEFLGQL